MAMPSRLEAGEVFENRYRVTKPIGAGGFAVVYLAEQLDLDRDVALKVLRRAGGEDGPKRVYDDTIVGRFEREAKLVSQLRDPNTITMYDYGQSDGGHLYMVFEFVDGISLKQLLNDQGRMSVERTTKVMRQVLMSLQEAHAVGVLHRDLKPANVMVFDQVGRQDQIKVLDFGIATRALRDKKDLTKDLTEEGTILGTPRYMAPEQIRGEELTPASDLYSVGLLGFEMLTGRRAISGATSIEVIGNQIAPESVSLPVELDLPDSVRQVLDRLLTKNVSVRYQHAGQVVDDLANGISTSELAGRTNREIPPPKGADSSGPADAVASSETARLPVPTTADWPSSSPHKPLAWALAAAGLIGLGVWYWSVGSSESTPSAGASDPNSRIGAETEPGKSSQAATATADHGASVGEDRDDSSAEAATDTQNVAHMPQRPTGEHSAIDDTGPDVGNGADEASDSAPENEASVAGAERSAHDHHAREADQSPSTNNPHPDRSPPEPKPSPSPVSHKSHKPEPDPESAPEPVPSKGGRDSEEAPSFWTLD